MNVYVWCEFYLAGKEHNFGCGSVFPLTTVEISRGNQRDRDRERAQARNTKKGQNKDDGLTPEQRRERLVGSLINFWSQLSDFFEDSISVRFIVVCPT